MACPGSCMRHGYISMWNEERSDEIMFSPSRLEALVQPWRNIALMSELDTVQATEKCCSSRLNCSKTHWQCNIQGSTVYQKYKMRSKSHLKVISSKGINSVSDN